MCQDVARTEQPRQAGGTLDRGRAAISELVRYAEETTSL
jgi:hypothetical protein